MVIHRNSFPTSSKNNLEMRHQPTEIGRNIFQTGRGKMYVREMQFFLILKDFVFGMTKKQDIMVTNNPTTKIHSTCGTNVELKLIGQLIKARKISSAQGR